MKKSMLSIAIIAILPFGAYATDPVGPVAVPSNGTAVVATANPPYQTLTPTNEDKQHIASTAYVKGAYNDSIAAINKVNYDKQDKLYNDNGNEIESNVIPAIDMVDDTIEAVRDLVDNGESLTDISLSLDSGAFGERLTTIGGVISAVVAGADVLNTKLNSKRVRIYTTWDNDTSAATRLVEFETAQQ